MLGADDICLKTIAVQRNADIDGFFSSIVTRATEKIMMERCEGVLESIEPGIKSLTHYNWNGKCKEIVAKICAHRISDEVQSMPKLTKSSIYIYSRFWIIRDTAGLGALILLYRVILVINLCYESHNINGSERIIG